MSKTETHCFSVSGFTVDVLHTFGDVIRMFESGISYKHVTSTSYDSRIVGLKFSLSEFCFPDFGLLLHGRDHCKFLWYPQCFNCCGDHGRPLLGYLPIRHVHEDWFHALLWGLARALRWIILVRIDLRHRVESGRIQLRKTTFFLVYCW